MLKHSVALCSLSILICLFPTEVLSHSKGAPCWTRTLRPGDARTSRGQGRYHVKYPSGHTNATNVMPDEGSQKSAPYWIEFGKGDRCYNPGQTYYVKIAGVNTFRGFLMAGVCYCRAIRGRFYAQRGISKLQCRDRSTHITHVDGREKMEVTVRWKAPRDYNQVNKKMRFVALVVENYERYYAYIQSQPLCPCADTSPECTGLQVPENREVEYGDYEGDYYYE